MIQLIKEIATELSKESGKPYIDVLLLVLPVYTREPLTLNNIHILLDISSETVTKTQKMAIKKLTQPHIGIILQENLKMIIKLKEPNRDLVYHTTHL